MGQEQRFESIRKSDQVANFGTMEYPSPWGCAPIYLGTLGYPQTMGMHPHGLGHPNTVYGNASQCTEVSQHVKIHSHELVPQSLGMHLLSHGGERMSS